MSSAAWELQKSVFETLVGNGVVSGLLGGSKVFDDVPREAEFPYVTFGQSVERDWSTGTDEGCEHLVSLHIWSRSNGRKQVQEITAAVHVALHDQTLSVSGHRLVNFRHEFSDSRRESDGETYHGIVRFRVVMEPDV